MHKFALVRSEESSSLRRRSKSIWEKGIAVR